MTSSIGTPELVGDHLGVGRLVALALRLGADRGDDLAGQVDLDVGRFPHRGAPAFADRADPFRRRDAADLDVGRQADAEELAARLGFGLPGRHVLVADGRQRLVHRRLVIARVDEDLLAVDGGPEPGRVVIGELVGRDEVPAPDLGRVHPDLGGEQVHRPLDDVGRLRPAGAAIGVDEGRVGVDARSPRTTHSGTCTARTGPGRRASSGCRGRSSTGGRRGWRRS